MMRNFIIGCALFGIFVAGGITGGAITARFIRPVTHERAAEQFAKQQFHRIAEQLNLSDEQRARIRPIITTASIQMQEHRKDISIVLERMDGELRAQLNDEQRAKYDHWRSQQRETEKRTQRLIREIRARRLDNLDALKSKISEPAGPSPSPSSTALPEAASEAK